VKVRFTGAEGREQSVRQGAHSLREGRVYVVLEVYCQAAGPNYFRIEYRSGETPPLFDARLFEVVDPRLSPSWTVSSKGDGVLTMAPAAWQVPGFWEEFMEHSSRAIEIYELGRDALMVDSE